MNLYYKLDENKKVLQATSDEVERGLKSLQSNPASFWRIGETTLGDLWVSTVFLGINHRMYSPGPPLVFETMIRNQSDDSWLNYQERYCTYEQALAGHNKAVEWVKSGCKGEVDDD